MGEILNSTGVWICIMNIWVFASLVTLTFPFIVDSLTIAGAFFIYLFASFLSILIVTFIVKETKGLTAKEIDKLFEVKNNKPSQYEIVKTD
jgi:hypothetical protein